MVGVGGSLGDRIQQRGRLSCLHILWRRVLRWYGDGLLVRWQQNLKRNRKPEGGLVMWFGEDETDSKRFPSTAINLFRAYS